MLANLAVLANLGIPGLQTCMLFGLLDVIAMLYIMPSDPVKTRHLRVEHSVYVCVEDLSKPVT